MSWRDEHGMSLVEVVVGVAGMLATMGIALTMLANAQRLEQRSYERYTTEDMARAGVERFSRQLRNLASPTPEQPRAVDLAEADDIVFHTVDPIGPGTAGGNEANVKRVRWCLDAKAGTLVAQEQKWTTAVPPAMPATSSCPDAGWTTQRVVAQGVMNAKEQAPVFRYDTTVLADISRIRVDLRVDAHDHEQKGTDPAFSTPSTRISSGVFLRNQNRAPVAVIDATYASNGRMILNGSQSYDPEAEPLRCGLHNDEGFAWYDGDKKIGSGVVLEYVVPTSERGMNHTFGLVVFDSACLPSARATKTFLVPAT